jgi:hypothetical protein
MDDRDSPWKELLDHDLALALDFLASDVHGEIDWRRNYETQEQEYRKMTPAAATGKRLADKVIKVFTHAGDERILHVEVQGDREADFERRVFVYHYRGDDHFGLPPEMIVILADDNPSWRPTTYRVELKRTTVIFTFEPIKLLDWADRKEELANHPNPVGLFILADLESRRTRDDPEERAKVKLDLILRLRERKMTGEELRHWYRYLDWFLPLSEERERALWEELKRLDKEETVPFVSYADRVGREEGRQEGLQEGLLQGLYDGIEALLEVKLGTEGLALLPQIRALTDPALLRSILTACKTAAGIEDIRRLLPSNGTAG